LAILSVVAVSEIELPPSGLAKNALGTSIKSSVFGNFIRRRGIGNRASFPLAWLKTLSVRLLNKKGV
jgi:hypothetical protein